MDLETLTAQYSANESRFMEEWKEFLRFDSVSTDPSFNASCSRCANWVVGHLTRIGFKSELIPTSSKPVVYGEYLVPGATKTVLFYGHYDVQPVDPLELWSSDPFKPEVRGARMYARGAQDNKGQVMFVLKALEVLIKERALKCNVKLFIEGEEEHGSEGFLEAMPVLAQRAKGDVLMVCDTGTISPGVGTISMGLRGIIGLTLTLHGPRKDLHSGIHGGMVRNPATEIARLIASLHKPDGSVAVEGFYDGVPPIDPADRELANQFPLTAEQYEALTGSQPLGGELSYTPIERNGFRPTVEINGVHSGYGGPGAKTIIPSTALAKISSRIVAGQDPERTLNRIIAHLERHTPPGVRIEISDRNTTGGALQLSSKSPIIGEARSVLREVTGRDPFFYWVGASVPVVGSFARAAGAEPLLIGFGLEDDNIHAPDESFDLGQFKQGFLYAGLMLSRF